MVSESNILALPAGTQLGEYRIDRELGSGGFGITYLARDVNLDTPVAIKEYLPADAAYRDEGATVRARSTGHHELFEWGLERFIQEARTLAQFRHPSIVQVYRFFREHGTAYLVMEYCEGEPLDKVLECEGRLDADRVQALLDQLLDALGKLHAQEVIHRDLKPANIFLRDDGTPVLLDFGSARQAIESQSRSVTAVVSAGYAPIEQYSTRGKQGPWTDIYGLAATLYRCVTGEKPPEASERVVADDLVPAVEAAGGGYPRALLASIDAALAVRPEERLQGVAAWPRLVSGESKASPGSGAFGVCQIESGQDEKYQQDWQNDSEKQRKGKERDSESSPEGSGQEPEKNDHEKVGRGIKGKKITKGRVLFGASLMALASTIYFYEEAPLGWGSDFIQPFQGGGYSHENFTVTNGSYSEEENNDQACKSEFGSNYRLADWDDVVSYYQSGASMNDFFINLGISAPGTEGSRSLMVSRSGAELYSSTRHYFISRHDHNKPGHYLAHDNIDNYLISLGSWNGSRPALCYEEDASER